VNWFDVSIIHFLNQFAQRSWFVDILISSIVNNLLIKGALVAAILWWAWFRETDRKIRDRELVLAGIIASTFGLFFARALAAWLPYRERPMRVEALHFVVPFGASALAVVNWSSFPSDHAVLFFALATSIFLISRTAGVIAYCHALFIVCLPRVYWGLHYPTDVLAGALIGIAIAYLCTRNRPRIALTRYPMLWSERSPETFYPCFYIFTFLLATIYDPLRDFFGAARHLTGFVLHHIL
jgi:undecaprenyl-diphosphatase